MQRSRNTCKLSFVQALFLPQIEKKKIIENKIFKN